MSDSDSDSQSEPEMTYNDLEATLSDADSETSETWNWRNAENNRLIIQLYKYDKAQDKRLDDIEKKLEELDLRNKPHGGRRTRGKLRARSRGGGGVHLKQVHNIIQPLKNEIMNLKSKITDLNNSVDEIKRRTGIGGRRKKRTKKRRKKRRKSRRKSRKKRRKSRRKRRR